MNDVPTEKEAVVRKEKLNLFGEKTYYVKDKAHLPLCNAEKFLFNSTSHHLQETEKSRKKRAT